MPAAAALDPSAASWLSPPSSAYSSLSATDAPPDTKAPTKPEAKTPVAAAGKQKVDFDEPSVQVPTGAGHEEILQAIGRLENERQNAPAPKIERPQKPMTVQDDAGIWGAAALVFAAFASLRTRSPMISALNAGAAAIQGYQQGQKDRADMAFQQWQMQTKYALENYQLEQRAYEDLMDNISKKEGFTLTAWGKLQSDDEMKLRLFTQQMNDPVAWDAYQKNGWDGLVDLRKKQDAQAQSVKDSAESVVKGRAMNEELEQVRASKEFNDAPPLEKAKMLAGAVEKTNPQKETMTEAQQRREAQMIIDGKRPYPSGARSVYPPADKAKIIGFVSEMDPNYNAKTYAISANLQKYYTTGAGADKLKAMRTLAGHVKTLEELEEKLPTNDLTAVQKFLITIGKQAAPTGAVIKSVDEAKTAVADEFNKVLIPSGAGTAEDRNRWMEIFEATTKPAMASAIETAKELVHSRTMTELKEALNPEYGLKPENLALNRGDLTSVFGLSDADMKEIGLGGGAPSATEEPAKAQKASLKLPTEAEKKSAVSIPLSTAKTPEEAQKMWDSAPSGWLTDGKGNYRWKP